MLVTHVHFVEEIQLKELLLEFGDVNNVEKQLREEHGL